MSTYWYFECKEHKPSIRSDGEFTQHTEDDAFKAALELARNRPIPADWYDRKSMSDDYFTANACRFLVQHPRCPLELVNEYGDRRGFDPGAREPGIYTDKYGYVWNFHADGSYEQLDSRKSAPPPTERYEPLTRLVPESL
jgi:chloramphenicol 3-O-phosphotransferase